MDAVMTQLQIAPEKPEEVSRVIQGIITGIGFLGAGVIIHHESEQYAGGPSERLLQRLFRDSQDETKDD